MQGIRGLCSTKEFDVERFLCLGKKSTDQLPSEDEKQFPGMCQKYPGELVQCNVFSTSKSLNLFPKNKLMNYKTISH